METALTYIDLLVAFTAMYMRLLRLNKHTHWRTRKFREGGLILR